MKTQPPKLVSFAQLARELRPLGVDKGWLAEEARSGRLPALRVGRRMVFDLGAVRDALAARAAAGESLPAVLAGVWKGARRG